jgi:signal transduction histidine kinase
MRLDKSRVKVAEVIGSVADLYEVLAEEKNVDMVIEVSPDLCITADRIRFQQVVANLVDNAIKYSNEGGRINIRAQPKNGDILISVSDNGVGISPDEIERIWDRLYRGDRSRSQRGLGLGLSFVQAIVHAHGGTVGVESQLNSGTTFVIRLPETA